MPVMLVFEALMALLFPTKPFETPPSPEGLLRQAMLENGSNGRNTAASSSASGGPQRLSVGPPERVVRSWMVIAKMLSLPAPRLAREMRRCVQVSLEGEDGHGGVAIARRVTLLRRYLMHPLWPSRHRVSQHDQRGGRSPAWLLPGLPREWLRAREFAEWVELAVGLYTLKADPAGLVTLAAEGKGSAGSKATSALARWEVLRVGHGEAAAAMEGTWWKGVAEDAAGTNPLVLLPRIELEGWAWMQGRAFDRELNGHMSVQKQ